MSSFVCHVCREVVRDLYQRWLERREFVREDRNARRNVTVLRHLCTRCLEAETAPASSQEAMF